MILSTAILKSQYSDYVNPLDKIRREVASGKLIRLTRGLYEDNKTVNPLFLAGVILSPSYISFEYALAYYGLIPERVASITSASLMVKKRKVFVNAFGRFVYSDVEPAAFSSGLSLIESGGYAAKIACPEKALCDCLSKWRTVSSIKDLKTLLFVDKRIYEEEFASLDHHELVRLAGLYRKKNLGLLVKLISKEYKDE